MGTIISATAISEDQPMLGSVALAVNAAEQCILDSGIPKSEIDILINVGLYRENNIAEPSMAALVQQKLGLNLDPIKAKPVGKMSFSIDLRNGSSGFLYAAQVVDSFIQNNTVQQVLIVAGDTHPSKMKSSELPFTHWGAAALLASSLKKEEGFRKFIFRTSSESDTGMLGYRKIFEDGNDGRNHITVDIHPGFYDRALGFATDTVKEFIIDNQLKLDNTVLITSQPTAGFGHALGRAVGFSHEQVVEYHDRYGDPHTSTMPLLFHVAKQEGRLANMEKVLFVSVSSGITVACGLYYL